MIARGSIVCLNGVNAGKVFKEFSPSLSRESFDNTTLSDTSKRYALGFTDGTISATGSLDADFEPSLGVGAGGDIDTVYDVLNDVYANRLPVYGAVSYGAITIGGLAFMFSANITSLSREVPLNALIMLGAEFQITGQPDMGVWLAESTLVNGTTNGASVDNGAGTSNGGVFQIHFDLDPTAALTNVKLQHSTNNSTWADLATITPGGLLNDGFYSQVEVSGTVHRYVRAQITCAEDAAIFRAAFARR